MAFSIRPFAGTDEDYQGIAELSLAVWPDDPTTLDEFKHSDETRPAGFLFRRIVVEVEGTIVGDAVYGEPHWFHRPGKYFVSGNVHPDWRRQGIGTALYERALSAISPLGPAMLVSFARENQLEGLRFLAKYQFQQVQREPVSHLDVDQFDWQRFGSVPERVEAQGIRLLPLSELMETDPDWQRHYYDLDWEIMQDVPAPDQLTRLTFDAFVERLYQSPAFCAPSQFIALDGEQWVGMSGLWLALADPAKLYTGLTGVLRSHRRRGIATALKVCGVRYARDHGVKLIDTDNEENNPMYQLNLELGFKPQPAWLQFEKRLVDPLPWEEDESGD